MNQSPNILIFMTDQQRGDSVLDGSSYRAQTPHLDSLRQRGLQFSRTFGPSPHCCPSRATFFTGLYPSRHGVWNNVNVANAISRDLRPGIRLWSEDLAAAGYAMHYSGKWHVSAYDSPRERGWQTNYCGHPPGAAAGEDVRAQALAKDWQRYDDKPESERSRREGEIIRPGFPAYVHYGLGRRRDDEDAVEDGIRHIVENTRTGRPWCSMIAVNGPHDPYFVPQKYLDLYPIEGIELPPNFGDEMRTRPALYRRTRQTFDQLSESEHRQALRHYLAYCTYMDAMLGQVLAALDRTGQAEDTLVLFISDHGDYAGEHGLWCKGLPCFRSAYHVPAVVSWPRGISRIGEVEQAFVSLADFAPTISAVAGLSSPENLTGNSLVPFFNEPAQPATWRDALFTQSNGNELYGIQRSIMTNDWKLVYNGFDFDELYDLQNDPWEQVNLADSPQHRDLRKQLMTRIWEFAREQQDECVNPYIMVGLAEYGPGVASALPFSPGN